MPIRISEIFSLSGQRKPSMLTISGPVELMNPSSPVTMTARRLTQKSISEASRSRSNERRRLSSVYVRQGRDMRSKSTCHGPGPGTLRRESSTSSCPLYRPQFGGRTSVNKPAAVAKSSESHSRKSSVSLTSSSNRSGGGSSSRSDSVVASMIAEIRLDLETPHIVDTNLPTTPDWVQEPIAAISNDWDTLQPPRWNNAELFGNYNIEEASIDETGLRIEDDMISPISPMPSPLFLGRVVEEPPPDPGTESGKWLTSQGPGSEGVSRRSIDWDDGWKATPRWDSTVSFCSSTEIEIGIETILPEDGQFTSRGSLCSLHSEPGEGLFTDDNNEKRISMTWKMLWIGKMQTVARTPEEEDLSPKSVRIFKESPNLLDSRSSSVCSVTFCFSDTIPSIVKSETVQQVSPTIGFSDPFQRPPIPTITRYESYDVDNLIGSYT